MLKKLIFFLNFCEDHSFSYHDQLEYSRENIINKIKTDNDRHLILYKNDSEIKMAHLCRDYNDSFITPNEFIKAYKEQYQK